MKTHYYLDWLEDEGFSEKLKNLIQKAISCRKSLVIVSAATEKFGQVDINDFSEIDWLKKADICFDKYHLIDHLIEKEDAVRFINNASVIFLCGRNVPHQMNLLKKYGLVNLIKETDAIVMGTSAGGMNMSAKWVDVRSDESNKINGKYPVFDGMGLGNFSFEAHFDINDTEKVKGRFALSNEMNVYVASEGGAIRVKDDKIDVIGKVYLISNSYVHELAETV